MGEWKHFWRSLKQLDGQWDDRFIGDTIVGDVFIENEEKRTSKRFSIVDYAIQYRVRRFCDFACFDHFLLAFFLHLLPCFAAVRVYF